MSNLITKLKEIPDPRRGQGRMHPLWEILLIVLMATMSGYIGERAKGDFVTKHKKELLKLFNPHHGKLPSYQTIDRALGKIDFDSLILIFQAWTKTLDVNVDNTSLTKDWVHLDGKSIKGTLENYNTKQQKFINLVSAFSSKRKQVLGFNLVENNKESEIPKVRDLIELLDLEGVIWTADALHCQKETAKLIATTKNDYVLQVKGNQKKLLNQLKKTVDHRQKNL
jgi:DDE_Tnp_1-associated/Transposase DDE domain